METMESVQIHSAQSDLIPGIGLNDGIAHAVERGQRRDFALLVAMFSDDLSATTPIDFPPEQQPEALRRQLSVPEPQRLTADEESYSRSAFIAGQFHQGGLSSARLSAGLCPDALVYPVEKAQGLDQEVYRNLSFHTKQKLESEPPAPVSSYCLYHELVKALRTDQMRTQA